MSKLFDDKQKLEYGMGQDKEDLQGTRKLFVWQRNNRKGNSVITYAIKDKHVEDLLNVRGKQEEEDEGDEIEKTMRIKEIWEL